MEKSIQRRKRRTCESHRSLRCALRFTELKYYSVCMIAESIPQLDSLSPDQKILLAAEVWRDAVGSGGESPNVAVVQALRERLSHYRENPDQVSTWEDVRARIVRHKNS